MIKHGPNVYIENITAEVMALLVDDDIFPVVKTESNWNDTNVCSPFSHYISYARQELRKIKNPLIKQILNLMLSLMGPVLKAGRLNHVVYVNNWLLTTNPSPSLSSDQIGRITAFLSRRFSGHALVFRSVNSFLNPDFYTALKRNRYQMVRSRRIYIVDTRRKAFKKNKNVRRDLNRLKKSGYQLLKSGQFHRTYVSRLTELYRLLYLNKYTYLNLQFTDSFFLNALDEEIFEFLVLRKNNRIDVFACQFRKGQIIYGVCLGYDTKLPRERHLIQHAFALLFDEAKNQKLFLHLSSGVGEFKRFRSARPYTEYDSVYLDHLPLNRRFPWIFLRLSLEMWQRFAAWLFRDKPELQ